MLHHKTQYFLNYLVVLTTYLHHPIDMCAILRTNKNVLIAFCYQWVLKYIIISTSSVLILLLYNITKTSTHKLGTVKSLSMHVRITSVASRVHVCVLPVEVGKAQSCRVTSYVPSPFLLCSKSTIEMGAPTLQKTKNVI